MPAFATTGPGLGIAGGLAVSAQPQRVSPRRAPARLRSTDWLSGEPRSLPEAGD